MRRAAILILSNLPDLESARKLAGVLLTGRLAACVNIGAPVESMYHWRGAIETGSEIPVWIKTCEDLYPKVEAAIVSHHPHEIPEIIAFPVVHGLPAYLDWVAAEASPVRG